MKRGPWEAWALRGPLRLRLPLCEKWERNPAQGAPLCVITVEPKGFKRARRRVGEWGRLAAGAATTSSWLGSTVLCRGRRCRQVRARVAELLGRTNGHVDWGARWQHPGVTDSRSCDNESWRWRLYCTEGDGGAWYGPGWQSYSGRLMVMVTGRARWLHPG